MYEKLDSLPITNISEEGEILENIDWSLWKRIRVEEKKDDTGRLTGIISYCCPISEEERSELSKEEIASLKAELAATDYKALKYMEGWISEEEYAPVKARRQEIRDKINELEAQL